MHLLPDGDDNDSTITSTMYYHTIDTSAIAGGDNASLLPNTAAAIDPQQSFIFGVPLDYTRPRPNSGRRNIGAAAAASKLTNATTGGGGADVATSAAADTFLEVLSEGASITSTQTNWAMVVRHWTLSTLFLPLYAIALVTYSWKNSPRQLGKIHGTLIIATSFVFYGLLWTMFALYLKYPQLRYVFPARQGWFVFFLYIMCCFAESMLKNTTTHKIPPRQYVPTSTTNEQGQPIVSVPVAVISTRRQSASHQSQQVDIDTFLDYILELAAPSKAKVQFGQLSSIIIAFHYGLAVLALHVYSFYGARSGGGGNGSNLDLPVIITYMIISTVMQFVLGLVILYPLGQVALRLSVRDKVARTFSDHVSAGGGSITTTAMDTFEYTFCLDTVENIRAWQTVRETLLRKYAFPTLYVDVVLSAAFTLWVPLVLVGAMDFLFRATVSPLALNAAMISILILCYLLVCVVMASQAQERLANTEPLRWQEYQFLIQQHHMDNIVIIRILRRLAQLIDQGRDQAVVFQVWGFPLNRKMSTFLGGVLFTVASSVLVRLSGSGVS